MPRGDFSNGGCNGERGQEIEVECEGVWYAGLVDKCHDEGNFAVTYTDEGDWEDRVPGSRIRVGKGQEIVKAAYVSSEPTEAELAEFKALVLSAPPAAKGKPTPEAIKIMQAHGQKEKDFLAKFGTDSVADEKREILNALKASLKGGKKGKKEKGAKKEKAEQPKAAKAAPKAKGSDMDQLNDFLKLKSYMEGCVFETCCFCSVTWAFTMVPATTSSLFAH
jgi:hypothetical protein